MPHPIDRSFMRKLYGRSTDGMIYRLIVPIALIVCPVAGFAQTATVAMTPAQLEAAKDAAARQAAARPATTLDDGAPRDRRVHGEVGFGIGTGGYRSIYGTAVAPIGDTGTVAISLAQTQFDAPRGRHR